MRARRSRADGGLKALDASTSDASSSDAPAPDGSPNDSLVVHVPFDEDAGATATDVTKNGHDVTFNGGAIWGPGHAGGAYVGNGSTSFGRAGTSARLDALSQRFTVAVWVHAEQQESPTPRIVSKRASWDIKLNSGRPQLSIRDDKGLLRGFYSLTPKVTGAWHHVAFTFDMGAIRGFVDGVESSGVGDLDGGFSAIPSTKQLVIGQLDGVDVPGPPDATTSLLGRIDDLRIYDRVLSDVEIKALAE